MTQTSELPFIVLESRRFFSDCGRYSKNDAYLFRLLATFLLTTEGDGR
jgi:hypothetical protein